MKERTIVTGVVAFGRRRCFGTRNTDVIFVAVQPSLFFGLCIAYAEGANGSKEITLMGTLIVGLISLALLVYLIIAMLWPEKF
jgi:K+-transporting ATPase KdpF subunit